MSSFGQFLSENKLWWILPIVLVLLLVGWMLVQEPPQGAEDQPSPFVYDVY